MGRKAGIHASSDGKKVCGGLEDFGVKNAKRMGGRKEKTGKGNKEE